VSKPKKHILTWDEDQAVEFELIGICSHHNDYRLAWSLNERLGIQLEKSDEDYHVMKKGAVVSSHSKYQFRDPENRIDFFMIKNKSMGKFLIPEKPTIDYFLFLFENVVHDPEELVKSLREVSSVLGAYIFDPHEIDSAENIILN
jgi:hypothetical protein